MRFRIRPAILALSLALTSPVALAQSGDDDAPGDWFLHDAQTGRYPGASVERAYAELIGARKPARMVVVAVIDGGVDVRHPALQGRLWTNPGEVAGNGRDDDGNGYVDDVHGWNFIGGPDGRSVNAATYEVTREYVRLRGKYEGKTEGQISDRAEFAYFQKVRSEVMQKRAEAQQQLPVVQGLHAAATEAVAQVRAALGLADDAPLTDADLDRYAPKTPEGRQARQRLLQLRGFGISYPELTEYLHQLEGQLAYGYNPDADERAVVGDDPNDLTQRHYGNNDVIGPDASHGTHVAGIIAALRQGFGARGVAEGVQIMAVRAVPNGDERDKDVANAIRYAADNGAHIINMSFGKSYSPQKSVVDEAVRYAESKGVLLVHAAGNSGEDVDTHDNFPRAGYADGTRAASWIEVGASGWQGGEALAAEFSNYGARSVDVFAPGVDIGSTLPEGRYGALDGTSMAAPVVSGVAALVWSFYPDLTAAQLRDVLVSTARRYPDLTVTRPGSEDRIPFARLSVTGGIVDAYAALQRAAQLSRAQ
jgi:subtilisin family serine protease